MPNLLDPDQAFAARYRGFVASAFDQFEFFGVDPMGVPRRHSFDHGYFAPTLVPHPPASSDPASAGERADRALAPLRRAVVRGVAGSGKTTLLRWLAWQAAIAVPVDEPAPIPFLLGFSHYRGSDLPGLEQLVSERLRATMPSGWVESMLGAGRVLLLLDGLDEVAVDDRDRIESWLQEYLNLYGDIRCVMSTRPSVVDEQRWADRGFRRLDLLPMSRYNIERFVRGWHVIAREDYRADTPADREARDWLAACEDNLLQTLGNRPALGGMSSSPLLCGLLCALHRDGEHLPENRKDVYDAALELLMVRWPLLRRRHRRGERVGSERSDEQEADVSIDVRLNSQELRKLLQRLAFWMVTNHQVVLDRESAPDRVRSSMAGLREDDPDRVLTYLARECGLLRELPDQALQFLHRTFRDHLAAKEVVDEENINLMLASADRPHWHDVVVMAGAHARPKERARVLRELVERSELESANRETFVLLATAILEQAPVLPAEQPEVRKLVEGAVRGLIPPQSINAADRLVDVGPLVLDLLPGSGRLDEDERVLMVRVLAGIAAGPNGATAVEWIKRMLESAPRGLVTRMLGELFTMWGRRGGYESYARDVLRGLSFADYPVSLQNPRRIEHVGYLYTITNLILREYSGGLEPVATLPSLRWLRMIRNNNVQLDALEDAPVLHSLHLQGCSTLLGSRPIDLAPLTRTTVRRLEISGFPTRVEFSGLAGARLQSLRISGEAARGDVCLPAELEVRHLAVLTKARGHVDFSAVQGVRSLVVDRTPEPDELAALPDLRRLCVVPTPSSRSS